MMENPRSGQQRPAWRTMVSLLIFLASALLWMLMIISSGDTLYFEPTSAAVARAAAARGPVLGFAAGCALAVVLLAWTARRVSLLALAVPAVLMLLLQLLLPDSAGMIICLVATAVVGAFCGSRLLVVQLATPGRPVAVRVAAALASTYAVALFILVALLLGEQLTGTGHLGRLHLSGLSLCGFVLTAAGLSSVALLLGIGSARIGRARSARMITAPLLCLFAAGCVGEVVDVVGGRTTSQSNGIGVVILILIIAPVALLGLRSSRQYSASGPLAGRHP